MRADDGVGWVRILPKLGEQLTGKMEILRRSCVTGVHAVLGSPNHVEVVARGITSSAVKTDDWVQGLGDSSRSECS